MRSTDGETWTKVDLPISGLVYKLVFGNNTFVALGGKRVLTSSDAITWTERAMTGYRAPLRWLPHDLYGGTYALGRFVVTGMSNALITNP
jgi:hypothetical protein